MHIPRAAALPASLAFIPAAFGAAANTLLVIDDSDSVAIKYDGPWTAMSQQNLVDAQSPDYLGTLTFSNLSAAFANISFIGTGVAVYGALIPAGTFTRVSQYTIDGQILRTYNPPQVGPQQHRVQFFASGALAYGQHTLVIENLGQAFYLDFIEIDTPNPAGEGANGTTTPQSSSNATSQTTQASKSAQASLPAQGCPAATTSSGLTSGDIAGIVVGVAALEALAIAAALWACRRRQHVSHSSVTPYDGPSKGDLDAHAVAEFPSSKGQQSLQHIWPPHGPPTGSSKVGEGTVYSSAPSDPSQLNASPAPLIVSTQAVSVGGPPNATWIRPSSFVHSALPAQVPADSKVSVNAPVAPGPLPVPPLEDPESYHAVTRTGPRRSMDGGMRIAGGPPGQAITMSEVGSQSVAHTLPPSYDLYAG